MLPNVVSTSTGWTFGGRSSTVRKSGLGAYADRLDAINSSIVGRSLFPSAPTCSIKNPYYVLCNKVCIVSQSSQSSRRLPDSHPGQSASLLPEQTRCYQIQEVSLSTTAVFGVHQRCLLSDME